jgi:hypothetical protein
MVAAPATTSKYSDQVETIAPMPWVAGDVSDRSPTV